MNGKRRRFFRVLEAGVALLALLVTHQLFWVLSDDLKGVLRFPNPSVFLLPAAPAGARAPSPAPLPFRLEPVRVSVPDLPVTGYAAGRRPVRIWVNGIGAEEVFPFAGRFTVNVPLRRGPNRIHASLEGERPPAPEQWFAAGTLTAIYTSPEPLPPRFVGAFERTPGRALALGLAEPASSVWVAAPPTGTPSMIPTDAIGAFRYEFPILAERPVEVRAARSEPELRTNPPAVLRFPESGALVLSRKVVIDVARDGRYSLEFRATVPPGTAPHEWAASRQLAAWDLVYFVFGLGLRAFPEVPPLAQAKPALEENRNEIAMTLDGRLAPEGSLVLYPGFGNLPPLLGPGDEIHLRAEDPARVVVHRPPTETTPEARIWRGPSASLERGPLLEILGSRRGPPAAGDKDDPRPENLVQFARQLQRMVPGLPSRLLWALLTAIPFIGLLWILRREEDQAAPEYRAELRAVTLTFLLFHLTILCWPLFAEIFRGLEALLDSIGAFSRGRIEAFQALAAIGRIHPFLVIGVMLLLHPVYQAARHPAAAAPASWGWRLVRWLLLWPAAAAVPAVLFRVLVDLRHALRGIRPTEAFPWEEFLAPLAVFAAAALVVWIFLYWFLRVLPGVAIRVRSAFGVSLAMLLVPMLPWMLDSAAGFTRHLLASGGAISPLFIPSELEDRIWLLVIVAVGTRLLLQLSRIAAQLFEWPALVAFFASRRALLLLVLFIPMSIPLRTVLGRARVDTLDLADLAYVIDDLLPYALLVGMVLFLRMSNPDDRFELGADARRVGALLFAFYLSGRTANLLFVPVPLLVGWYVFTRWLARGGAAEAADPAARQILVGGLLYHRRTQALVEDLRKGLGKKYAEGALG